MRICMFLNAGISGDQRVYKEARTLANNGYEVTVLCNQPEDTLISSLWDGITVISLPRRPSLFFPLRFTIQWLRTAVRLRPDVVHAHDLCTLGRACLVARWTGARLVYDSHDFYTETSFVLRMPAYRKKYYYWKEAILIKFADRVIHAVPELCRVAAREFKIPEPTWIANFPLGESPPRNTSIHDRFKLSPHKKIVIYEGILALDRGLENLVLCARHLSDEAVVVFVGKGYLEPVLRRLVKNHHLEEKVKLLCDDSQDRFPVYCASAYLGVAIYQRKGLTWDCGWSTKVFDYMRAGLPVIISGSVETSRLVSENRVGVEVSDPTPENLASTITSLLEDKAAYRQYSANARKAWRGRFNWDTEAPKLLKLYREIRA